MESADGDSSSSERSKASSEGPFPIPKRSHGSGKKKYGLVLILCVIEQNIHKGSNNCMVLLDKSWFKTEIQVPCSSQMLLYMYVTCLLLYRSTTTSSLEVSSSGGSCPTSPSIQHRGMKHSGSETNVWSRLANSSHDSSAEKGYIHVETN